MFELAPFALSADYGESIVSLAAVKDHVSELGDDRDDLIGFCRDAAVDMVERYCGVRLAPCEGLVWRGECLPRTLDLGVWPVNGISAVTWLGSTGAAVNGDAAIWRVVSRDRLVLRPGAAAPSGVAAGVEITFDAGFDDDTRPRVLVQAVKMFAAHLLDNREAVITGTISGEIPLGFRQLCGQVRMARI